MGCDIAQHVVYRGSLNPTVVMSLHIHIDITVARDIAQHVVYTHHIGGWGSLNPRVITSLHIVIAIQSS